MFTVETKDNCTIFKATGTVSANDIILQAAQYMTGKQTEKTLWDFTETAELKITTMEMKGIADSLRKISTEKMGGKVALVVSNTVNIGLGKVFTAFAQIAEIPTTFKVFRDMDHANRWLAGK